MGKKGLRVGLSTTRHGMNAARHFDALHYSNQYFTQGTEMRPITWPTYKPACPMSANPIPPRPFSCRLAKKRAAASGIFGETLWPSAYAGRGARDAHFQLAHDRLQHQRPQQPLPGAVRAHGSRRMRTQRRVLQCTHHRARQMRALPAGFGGVSGDAPTGVCARAAAALWVKWVI